MIAKLNWDNIPSEEVTPSMHRKIVWGEKLMIAKMKFKDGFTVPLHSHIHEQVTQVVSGKMRFWFGENKEQVMDLFPGDVIVIPANPAWVETMYQLLPRRQSSTLHAAGWME